jgi:hypothetical protein
MAKQKGIKAWHVIVGIFVILVVTGYINLSGLLGGILGGPQIIYTAPDGTTFTNYNNYLIYMDANFPNVDVDDQDIPDTTRDPATLQFSTYNFVTRTAVTTATTTADITKAVNGKFDLMTSADTLTVSSTPDQTAQYFSEGDEIIIRVDCTGNPTNGLDYYDGWYYVKIKEGNSIYFLTRDMVSGTPGNYVVNTAGAQKTTSKVVYTSGTTPYWDIGQLYLYPRQAVADFDIYLTYSGVDLASVTDGSTWVDTAAEITANATMADTDEDITFSMYAGNADLGWGWPTLVVTSTGELKEYEAVLIFSTAMTSIGTQDFLDEGWKAINDGTLYAEKAFYKVIGPYYPAKGAKSSFSVNIPINSAAAAASTAFLSKLWVIDLQNPDNVAIGSVSTSVPTAYGFVTAYGPGAMVQAKAYTTSSGAGSGNVLQVYITTPS